MYSLCRPHVLLLSLLFGSGLACNSTCVGQMQREYIEGLQNKLLRELQIHTPPRVTPPEMSQAELDSLYFADDEENQQQTRSIVSGKRCDLAVLCAGFPLSKPTAEATIHRAKVNVYLDMSPFEGDSLVQVRVYRRLSDGSLGSIVAEETFTVSGPGRVSIDIPANELQNWEEEGVVGFYFDATVGDTNVAVHPEQAMNNAQMPTVTLDIEKPKPRQRRSGDLYCGPESQEKGCCLHDMIIDFNKLGWNFIMAPKRYNAFMCRGDCAVNHHHLVRFGHSKLMRDAKLGGESHCCHPSDYESLKVIYTRQDNEIIITRVPGMIARRCTCT